MHVTVKFVKGTSGFTSSELYKCVMRCDCNMVVRNTFTL